MFPSLPERYREEQIFIREILFEPTDLSARLVYADWLEERQDPRAQMLRIDVELQEPPSSDLRYQSLLQERLKLLPKLDREWVNLLALAPIERCPGSTKSYDQQTSSDGSEPEIVEMRYRCPKRWENLKPSEEAADARFCNECERTVYYCYTIETARSHAQRGHCVALDPMVPRKPYDLDYIRSSELRIEMGMMGLGGV